MPSFAYMKQAPTRFVLSEPDRAALKRFTRAGTAPVRAVERAQVLLRLGAGLSGRAVATERRLHPTTVCRVRQRYLARGLAAALAERPRSGHPVSSDGATQAALAALACTPPSVGHGR